MPISTVNVSQIVTDRVHIAIANKYKVAYGFPLAYLHLTLVCSKVQGQGHAHFELVSCKWWLIGKTLLLATNRKSHVGFRLADLSLTLVYSKGQLGSWKDVWPNILAGLFYFNISLTLKSLTLHLLKTNDNDIQFILICNVVLLSFWLNLEVNQY